MIIRSLEGIRFAEFPGSGHLPPLVLLHGLGNSLEFWTHLVPRIEYGGRVIVPDIPGFGESSSPPTGFGLQTVQNSLVELFKELGLESPLVCGHSMGAIVGLGVAADIEVSGVVLVNGLLFTALKILRDPRFGLVNPRVAVSLAAQTIAGILPMTPSIAPCHRVKFVDSSGRPLALCRVARRSRLRPA